MYKEILTNTNAKFNTIEIKIRDFLFALGLQIMKAFLEKKDEEILKETRNNRLLQPHDKIKTTVKTIMGDCEYTRRKWYEYEVKKGKLVYKKTRYLLDEYLEIKFDGLYSENFVNAIIEAFFNSESYRACSHTCEALFGVTISHESIRRIVIDLGQKEKNKEKERIRAVEKEQLIPDEQRDISVLFGEVDGINIKLQGKDKAKIIEKNIKRAEKKYQDETRRKVEIDKIKKSRVRREMKMSCFHEGWIVNGKRSNLFNKSYTVGFDTPKELKQKIRAMIKNKYDISKIKHFIINGDGAGWIKNLSIKELENKKIYQRDSFHICKELRHKLDKEDAICLEKLYKNGEYDLMTGTLDALEPWYEENGLMKKYNEVKEYISEGLERYKDKLKEMPEPPKGLQYKTMGNAESNIYALLSSKLRSKRKSFSIKGAESIAYIMKMKMQGINIIETLQQKIQLDTSVEDYINELEKKAKENKYLGKSDGITNKYDYPVKSSLSEIYSIFNNALGNGNIGTMDFLTM